MTILEKRSATRVKALRRLVEKGEYSPEYALGKLDELNSKGLLTASDYEETFDWLAELMEQEEVVDEVIEEPIEEVTDEIIEEVTDEIAESEEQ